jgi:UDP-glucose 4-epimerase
MTPLITGGCGFIGSHLCEFYNQGGAEVMALDDLSSGKRSNIVTPPGVVLTVGDVADEAVVAPLVEQASVVYHLAAIASVAICTNEPERAHRTNVIGTQTLFNAVAKAQKKTGRTIPVVYASSAAIYGDNPNIPLSESALPAPINLYGEHKLENERIAARAFAEHGVRSVGLRFFNAYGPRQDPSSPYSGVISKFVDNARAGRGLTIFGDGEQTRDFIYVNDIVNMLCNSGDFARGIMPHGRVPTGADIFNVCTGSATNLKLLARTIATLLHMREHVVDFTEPRPGDIRHSLGDPFAIMEAYNVVHWTPLVTGLQETLAYHA